MERIRPFKHDLLAWHKQRSTQRSCRVPEVLASCTPAVAHALSLLCFVHFVPCVLILHCNYGERRHLLVSYVLLLEDVVVFLLHNYILSATLLMRA